MIIDQDTRLFGFSGIICVSCEPHVTTEYTLRMHFGNGRGASADTPRSRVIALHVPERMRQLRFLKLKESALEARAHWMERRRRYYATARYTWPDTDLRILGDWARVCPCI